MKITFDKAEIEQSIIARFEKQVRLFPDRLAVKDVNGALDFTGIDRAANRIAARLLDEYGEKRAAVAILLEHSLPAIVAILAVLKTGRYYLPLDPSYPRNAIEHMLRDSGTDVMLTNQATIGLARDLAGRGVGVCNIDDIDEAAPDRNPAVPIHPDAVACILYTSGSTGLPKGILHTHRTILHHIWGHSRILDLQTCDRQALLLSYSFAASVSEIFGALLNGIPLSLNNVRKTGLESLARWLRDERITTFKLPVSLFRIFLATLKGDKDFPDLRLIVLGGDALFKKDVELFRRFFSRDCLLVNRLASTETFTVTRLVIDREMELNDRIVPVGYPDADKDVIILVEEGHPAQDGQIGEIAVRSPYLATGYWQSPEMTEARFRLDNSGKGVTFLTGDMGRVRPDGCLEHFGRKDNQVKIRGYRIDLSSVEAAITALDPVKGALVTVHETEGTAGVRKLVAYVVPHDRKALTASYLRNAMAQTLPGYMLPANYIIIEAFPLTSSGKIDRLSLPALQKTRPLLDTSYVAPRTPTEKNIVAIWSEALGLEQVGVIDNFFDLGGDSLMLLAAHTHIQDVFAMDIPLVMLFQYPTVRALGQFIDNRKGLHQDANPVRAGDNILNTGDAEWHREGEEQVAADDSPLLRDDIAIIGMAGRFPGSKDLDAFWENLKNGVQALGRYSPEELRAAQVDESLLNNPNYVNVGAVLDGIEAFDAAFFGLSPAEAAVLDPQHRLFMETVWHALEDAGYTPDRFKGRIGLFGGASSSVYLQEHILPHRHLLPAVNDITIKLSNSAEFMANRTAYKLNLTGPAINITTACSTSLVAVHYACQSLRLKECEMALAGGVAVEMPQISGYLYQEGWLASPDGCCRPFDAAAKGTVISNGVGVVLLKRLTEAVRDGDTVHAVIKGSAVNNDGSLKMGFTAPSVDGQAAVIEAAQRNAGISAESITYVETHGTGTALGDPVEIAALTKAFRRMTGKTEYCAIGSVKANIGHASRAAGIAGLIKTILALRNRQIPPLVNFERPNPAIDFSASPFYVNTSLKEWHSEADSPRRAAVSSFGIGGTNAHVILEEAPPQPVQEASKPWQLLVLSAKSEASLEAATGNLANYLKRDRDHELADIAFTLQAGRGEFHHRRMLVCRDREDALARLAAPERPFVESNHEVLERSDPVFMFPALAVPYVGMTVDLYRQEPLFGAIMDRCAELLTPLLGQDIRDALYPKKGGIRKAAQLLSNAALSQAAIFSTEYAMARLWMSWGIYPTALAGYDVGEYTAACLAGIMTLEDALSVIAFRGRSMPSISGKMLAVELPEGDAASLLTGDMAVVAVAETGTCVLAGPVRDLQRLAKKFAQQKIASRFIEGIATIPPPAFTRAHGEFTEHIRTIPLQKPAIPVISAADGSWLTPEEASDPGYWGRNPGRTMRIADGLKTLALSNQDLLVAMGPTGAWDVLSGKRSVTVSPFRPAGAGSDEREVLLWAVGQMWLHGVEVDWKALQGREQRKRIPLPFYPFDKKRYWIPRVNPRLPSRTEPFTF